VTKQTDFLSSEATAAGAVLLLAIGYLLVGYLTLSPGLNWGDDSAQYVNHARNLATGRAYEDTGYIFNPQAPRVGPPSYPPGFPLLLAPIVKVFGLDFIALKSVSLVCMTAAILFTFLLFREALGAAVAAGTAFLFGLHWFSWTLRNDILSEPPYILWTLLSLYVASRHVHRRGIVTGALCGLFAYAAFATRPIGIVLIVAVLAYEIAQRRLFSWRFLCIAGIPAVGIKLQRHFLTVGDYSTQLHPPVMTELAGNVLDYWRAAGELFPLGGKLSLLSPVVLATLALLGIGYRLRSADERARSAASPPGLPPWALLQRIPVDLWYLGLYLGAIVVFPVYQARYLFPILPILCAYIVYAISRGLEGTRYRRAAILALCAAGLCYYAALHWWAHRVTPGDDDALCDDCRAMYTFIRNNTAPGSRVAFAKPRAMALLANRPAWVWASSQDRRFDWDSLQRTHINYIVLVPPTHRLASRYPAELGWDAWRSNPNLHLMFENASFRVLRLNSTKDE
jgi:hypothetical protein